MELEIFHVDAFTSRLFAGNTGAVVPLDDWLDDDLLQRLAAQNNMPGNAFFVPGGPADADYSIRFFTPAVEVALSGHTCLCAAYVILRFLRPDATAIRLSSKQGPLEARRDNAFITLDFPVLRPEEGRDPGDVAAALHAEPAEMLCGMDAMAVFRSDEQIRALKPDMEAVAALDCRALIVTAPGTDCDFVSRVFGPRAGVPEDQATGSAHCMLAPYWGKRLGKTAMLARQLSQRGGEIRCRLEGERVMLSGNAVLYQRGRIFL